MPRGLVDVFSSLATASVAVATTTRALSAASFAVAAATRALSATSLALSSATRALSAASFAFPAASFAVAATTCSLSTASFAVATTTRALAAAALTLSAATRTFPAPAVAAARNPLCNPCRHLGGVPLDSDDGRVHAPRFGDRARVVWNAAFDLSQPPWLRLWERQPVCLSKRRRCHVQPLSGLVDLEMCMRLGRVAAATEPQPAAEPSYTEPSAALALAAASLSTFY